MTITNLVNLARLQEFGALRPNVINDCSRTNKVGQIFYGDTNDNHVKNSVGHIIGDNNTVIINGNNNSDNSCCQGNHQNRMMMRMLQMLTQMFGGMMQLFSQMIGSLGNSNQLGNCGSYASLLNGGLDEGVFF